MSKRLASFHGPSTPTSSPVSQPKHPNTPASPSRTAETTIHRQTRTLLLELQSITRTWDDLVLADGLKAARGLVDTRTELDNALAALPPNRQPRSSIVGPNLVVMDKCIAQLDAVLNNLQKQLRRMGTVVDKLESLYHEAQGTKGSKWCKEEPLWVSWSLEKFVLSLGSLTTPYHRSLALLTDLTDQLRSHSVSFEVSKDIISQWVEQPYLEEDGWDAKWEDLCSVEVERWK